MPHPGKAWWRVDIGTYRSWLPGSARGFRSHDHRIHSTGDYRNPPPQHEHAGLRRYHQSHSSSAILIPRELRLIIATSIAEVLRSAGHEVIVVSSADQHAHIVAELPVDKRRFNQLIGTAKCRSSLTVRKWLPGRVWGHDDRHDMLRTRSYQLNAFRYVRDKQGRQAAVWCIDGLRREALIE
jgi:hypothetical protein